jgi:plastocyanin
MRLGALMLLIGLAPAMAEVATVRGRVELVSAGKARHPRPPVAVVWLTPVTGPSSDPPAVPAPGGLRLVQRHKSFEPHVLVVPAGASVEFPNHDPFFHNVFSLFEGKRFDLGLYEAGTSRMVRFDRPGVSYIFCNIHPEMSAVVITLDSRWYAVSKGDGQLSIADVPYGRYMLHIWSEGMGPDSKENAREVTIGEDASLGLIRVPADSGDHVAHKNKYGRDYDAPVPDSSVYQRQR